MFARLRATFPGRLTFALALVAARLSAAEPEPRDYVLTADEPASFDGRTGEAVFRKNARFVYREWTLVADEIHFNQRTREATASGHILAFRPGLRLLGDTAHFRMSDRSVELTGVRFGHPPIHVEGRRAHGNADEMTIEDAVIIYGEPDALAPRATARKLEVFKDEHVEAEGLRFSLGAVPVLALSGLARPLDTHGLRWETRTGLDNKLGLQLGAGVYAPFAPGFAAGGSLDLLTNRGVLAGPGARYAITRGDTVANGSADLAYIRDTGDRATRGADVLGRQVGDDRFFWSWKHAQRSSDRWTLNGELNWWSDSAVVRDFRDDDFNRDQEPDNFLEATLNGPNYLLSAFTRIRPNDFQLVPERLPEIRFDLLPTPVGATGALVLLESSAAALREKSLAGSPELRSDRFDLYGGASRTFVVARGITFTPVAGGRVTHYDRAENGRSDYTRWLGEVGFDAHLRAYSVKELEKPIWGIDGIRHVIEPRLEYRYVPTADRGRRFIPDIDRPAFLTQLQPLGLAGRRDIDELDEIHAIRLGVNNTVETRREDYGSRRLVQFDLAADFYLSRPRDRENTSDVQAELHLTPADWLDAWFFMRVDPEDPDLREFNTRVMLVDGRAWTLGVDGDYLQHDIEQVQLFGSYALDEANSLHASVRYDARENRFNEIRLQLFRRLSQNWVARLGVSFRDGQLRESSFGVKFDVRFLEF